MAGVPDRGAVDCPPSARWWYTRSAGVPDEGSGRRPIRATVEDLAKRVLDRLETGLATLLDLPAV